MSKGGISMALLEIKNVDISYGKRVTVKNVSLDLNAGEICSIVGESGSGKTTVIRAVLGLIAGGGKVTAGDIIYEGRSLLKLTPAEWRDLRGHDISMIFQDSGAMMNQTRLIGHSYVEYIRTHENISKEEAWKKMAQLLKEGYALPLDYTVGVEQRKTRALLLENEVVVQTKEDDMKEFATPAVRRAIWTGAAKVWPKIAENDKDENDGEDNDDSDDKRSAKRRDCFMKPMMPVSLCMADTRAGGGADTPVGKIIRELGLNIEDVLIDPSNFKDLNQGLDDATVDDIKNLMKYCVISRDRNFVSGKDKASDIVRSLLEYSNSPTNLSVSRYYCETQVDPKSRMAVKEMGEIMRRTFMNRIERNAWLDAESKAGAKEKLEKMLILVGWPDQWNESAEATVKDDGAMNTYDLICDLFKQRTSKTIPALAGKTDADDFFMTELTEMPAWEANAFYAPTNNEVLICASNLQPPIYDPTKDIVYNYALMGAPTLGHEMTHGFDATGALFDAIGAIRDWMSPRILSRLRLRMDGKGHPPTLSGIHYG